MARRAPGGPSKAEPGAAPGRGGAQRSRLDQIRLNSATDVARQRCSAAVITRCPRSLGAHGSGGCRSFPSLPAQIAGRGVGWSTSGPQSPERPIFRGPRGSRRVHHGPLERVIRRHRLLGSSLPAWAARSPDDHGGARLTFGWTQGTSEMSFCLKSGGSTVRSCP